MKTFTASGNTRFEEFLSLEDKIASLITGLEQENAALRAALAWALEWVATPSRDEFETVEAYSEHMKQCQVVYDLAKTAGGLPQ